MQATPDQSQAQMFHQVIIDNTGESYRCGEDVNVLAAMEQVCCHGIPVGCRNGGCGACKIRIISGRFQTKKMSRAVVSAAEECDGCVLACRTFPRSDLRIRVLGRVWQTAKLSQSTSFSFGFSWTTRISRPDEEA